jgi:hypothetical protein
MDLKQFNENHNLKKDIVHPLIKLKESHKEIYIYCSKKYYEQVFSEIINVIIADMKEYDVNIKLIHQYDNIINTRDDLYIIFNSHFNEFDYTRNYAIFNYEQIGHECMKTDKYINLINNGICLFEYSHLNKSYLEKVVKVPIYLIPHKYNKCIQFNTLANDTFNPPYDVLFYGGLNENRIKYINLLRDNKIKIKYIADYSFYGAKLYQELRNYKIVLNLHYYTNPSVLELSRIVPLIANSKLVFSERSTDKLADYRFEDMIVFIDETNIVAECKKYIKNENLRIQKVKNSYRLLINEKWENIINSKIGIQRLNKNINLIMNVRSDRNTDIFEHLSTLCKYASECESIIELGVRNSVSSYAFIKGLMMDDEEKKEQRKKLMVSVDKVKSDYMIEFETLMYAINDKVDFSFYIGNDLVYEIKNNFDLVFIDSWHVKGQLQRELKKYPPNCNKYILIHDTSIDEFVGESIRNGWDIQKQSEETGFSIKEIQEGLWPAIMDFLEENKNWKIKERFKNNNGLTILEKIDS